LLKRARWAVAPLAAALLLPSAAPAAITPTRDAVALANAVAVDSSVVTGATFPTIADPGSPPDPSFNPAALSDTPLGGFPRNGSTYAILSTGDATLADKPNDSGSAGVDLGMGPATAGRGDKAQDVLVWQINLNVPSNANCLVVRFRFLSEEFPEFVGSAFNDAFIAELDKSTWITTGDEAAAVNAPDNFAYDEKGNPVTVNATGVSTATAENAAGTTFDGATRRLAAAKAVSPGSHTLFLSIFDQADGILDSAALVDDLQLINADPARCTSGAFFDDAAPVASVGGDIAAAPEPLVTDGKATNDDTPTFGGKAGTTLNDDPEITGTIYSAASVRAVAVNGTAVQTKKAKVGADGSWILTADTLPEGSYVFQASQGSSNGQTTVTDPVRFTVDKTAPKPGVGTVGFGNKTRDTTPLLTGALGTAGGDAAAAVVRLYAGKTAAGAPVQTLAATVAGGAWNATVPAALKDGTYTAVVEQADAAGNLGKGSAAFDVTTANPIGKVALAKKLTSAKAAKGLKGSLAFAFPGKVTYALTAKVGKKTLKLGTVSKTLAQPGKAAFNLKPKKSVAAQLKRSRGKLTLKTSFVDDQGRRYSRTQKVSFR
jgi:hypothetical protein